MSTYSIFYKLLMESKQNQTLVEDLEEQPDMFSDAGSKFYDDGEEIVKVVPNANGSKAYVFDQENSDMIDSLLQDPSDYTPVIQMLAQAYASDDDTVSKLFANANREDSLVFNTSKNGKIKISMSDIFDYIKYYNREERIARAQRQNTVEEAGEEDWVTKWKDGKKYFESITTNSEYVNNLKKVFEEAIKE